MAENVDLNIKIGANTSDLQTGLTQASAAINNFGTQISRVSKPAGDATQSLTNLSRIAQDAPYGFIGIANNINPMLESFQRLQKETGGTGNALKAMVAGLAGPAGIGVAVGVATSAIVAFGPKIMEFINQTTDAEKAQKKMRDALSESTGAVEADKVKLEALVQIVNNVNNSTNEREAALKRLKDQYKGNVELQKADINDGEKLVAIINNITDALMRKAKIEAFSKLIAEEQAKQVRLQISTLGEQIDNLSVLDKAISVVGGAFKGMAGGLNGLGIGMDLVNNAVNNNQKEIKTSAEIVKVFTKNVQDLTKAQIENNDVNNTSTTAAKAGKTAKEKQSKLKLGYEDLEGFDSMESKMADERRSLFGNKMGANILGNTFGDNGKPQSKESLKAGQKDMDEFFKKNQEQFKILNDQAKEFANTIADTATNAIMGLWSAFEQGQGVGEALGNMFMDLAKQIAAAAIKAAIFQTILGAITGGGSTAIGAAGAAGGGGFMSMFKGLLGLAEGGIVNKPTLAMVGEGNQSEAVMPLSKLGSMMQNTFDAGAMSGTGGGGGGQFTLKGNDLVLALNRSNYSLNLRRGS
jgi:hypothetical protein